MASRGKSARVKGASFEREIANKISDFLKIVFKRGLGQTRGGGAECADIFSEDLPQLHFELKRQAKPNIKAAYNQANDDAPNKIKVIITKADREPTLVTMSMEDWLPFLKAYKESL